MQHITVENLDHEIKYFIEDRELNQKNLECLALMFQVKKYMKRMCHGFSREDAREWVSEMYPPARWTMDQTTAVMRQRGYDREPYVFWAVMNSLFSDYGKTMAKYNADSPEIWADLAEDFINDDDAKKDKIGLYWREIVDRKK